MRMEKKKRNRFLVVWLGLIVLTLVAVLAVGGGGESASIKETMRDAVLHGPNPGCYSHLTLPPTSRE